MVSWFGKINKVSIWKNTDTVYVFDFIALNEFNYYQIHSIGIQMSLPREMGEK